MKANIILVILLVGLVLSNSSPSTAERKPPLTDEQRPFWISYSSGAYQAETLLFYGVGTAKEITNKALLKQAAYNRARSNLYQVIQTFVAMLMNSYVKEMEQKKRDFSMEEQHIGLLLKSMINVADLKNIRQGSYWIDQANNTGYALVSFTLEEYVKRLAAAKELSPELRSFVLDHAKQIFLELTNE
jgi:hypothetical protein